MTVTGVHVCVHVSALASSVVLIQQEAEKVTFLFSSV